VLVLIDELQEATPNELAALNTAVHHVGQADVSVPVLFMGAGLPSLPSQLAEATSYAERLCDYRSIGLLDDEDARRALSVSVPARQRDVEWSEDGLVGAGYPRPA